MTIIVEHKNGKKPKIGFSDVKVTVINYDKNRLYMWTEKNSKEAESISLENALSIYIEEQENEK